MSKPVDGPPANEPLRDATHAHSHGNRFPAWRGGLLALVAAALFGASTPVVQRFGAGVGSFATAALLYAGAAVAGFLMRRDVGAEARVRGGDYARLAWMTLFGAVVGPVALVWGLQRTSATSASLMLALEAVLTAAAATLFYREHLGRRAAIAMALMTAGALALVVDRAAGGRAGLPGLLAVVGATAAWALDNTLSRGLSDRDPGQVVMLKSALGAAIALLCAGLTQPTLPPLGASAGLFAVGALGYGLSLRFYLLAQRALGSSRTASIFAFAPLIGAACAVVLGDRVGAGVAVGAALMAVGIVLHLTERHGHWHDHVGLEHEHAHVHDDAHHTHRHDRLPEGAHSHAHRHDPIGHAHAHMPDEHHTHAH